MFSPTAQFPCLCFISFVPRTIEPLAGLAASEARARLVTDGANELPQQKPRSWLRIAFTIIREPMFALLLGSGVIYLLLGSLEEALLLLFFAGSSVGIAIVQEGRSERVLDALRDLTSPRALVVRDGERLRIPSREVIRGDLIVLAEGDRVPADAVIRAAEDLQADESLLTGEAIPVRKRPAEDADQIPPGPGGEDLPYVFSSTLIVRGSGLAEVTATGVRSKVGQIGRTLAGIEATTPRLTLETRNVVRTVAILGILCSVIAVVLFGLFRGSWLQALLAGIALGMSMIPEEFPLVLTVFIVMGAWRLSRVRVLTRRAAAIETLGAATVLCTDKTGTLTENRMSIAEVRTENEAVRLEGTKAGPLSPAASAVIAYGAFASASDPFDPMEKAFHGLHGRLASAGAGILKKGLPAKIYPLRRDLLAVTQAWPDADRGGYDIAVKGAPEAVVRLCRLDAARAQAVQRDIDEMAEAGMRVIAVAGGRHAAAALPDNAAEFQFEFFGLVGLADPIRGNVPAAMQECRNAGIRVIMITGDYPLTARAIALRAGLPEGQIVTGDALDEMSDASLGEIIGHVNIFARIAPEQKLRLVRALKAQGEIVAMTGDGVNDAPALRAADIGVAMGSRGTDVAREASSIVLLDDDFNSIVRTVKLGRRIYDNLRKAMGYILAVHIPIAGMALLPLLTGLPVIFSPIHIAFLEMIIDPVCSIVFEAERAEDNVMNRPPRPPRARLLSAGLIQWSVVQGCVAFGIVAAIYIAGFRLHMPDADLRALTFVALVCGNLSLVIVNRTFSAGGVKLFRGISKVFWMISGIVVAVLAVAILWPPASALFEFGAFHAHDLADVALSALAVLAILESVKFIWPARFQRILTG